MALRITWIKPGRARRDSRLLVLVLLVACGGAAAPPPSKPHTIQRRGTCPPEREDGAYDLGADQVSARRGTTARQFGDTVSTQAAPIQVCGVYGELAWLSRLACADGSKPFANFTAAHAARQGSMMPAGLVCDRPVDHYVVPCPERAYEIYFDMYQCGPGEELWRDTGLPSKP